MEIKLEDWVIVNKNAKVDGFSKIMQDHGLPSKVYKIEEGGLNKVVYCRTVDLAFNLFGTLPFIIKKEYVTVIENKEAEKIIKIKNKELSKEFIARKRLLRIKHVSIRNRKDYDLNSKLLIKTNFNYLFFNKLNVLKENIHFDNETKVFQQECCACTKVSSDIILYIPKSWLRYFGYNLPDLNRYIKFLENCEIGFKAEVLEEKPLYEEFKRMPHKAFSNLTNKANNFYLEENEIAYKILLRGSKTRMLTYLYFILIRYIYNNQYWNIPFIAMKLKLKMPNLTNWQCLILALNTEMYNAYYSLASISHDCIVLSTDKMNTVKSIIAKITNNEFSVNGSFQVIANRQDEVSEMIKNENYEELQKLLDNNK